MDKPGKNQVPMDNSLVKQHKRMAAGQKVTGQTLPSAPKSTKTPA